MRPTRALSAAAVAAALALGADVPMSRDARAFPSLSELPQTPLGFQDVALASMGFRAAGADLAWVQLLQYAAEGLPEYPDPPGRGYSHLKDLTLRVVRLDPAFHHAYLYGAGILGWFKGVDAPDDAVAILEEARRRDPGPKQYDMYIAALAYKKAGDYERMTRMLDDIYDDPQTSPQLRAILANIHKSRGEYEIALRIWEDILGHERDASEHARARLQIPELKRLIRERRRQ
jgi:tetratricopeptide (TPR) repeat protein